MRLQRRLEALASTSAEIRPWLPTLEAIALIETRERPLPARVLERLAQLLPGKTPTCGPFQMRDAPWKFEHAAQEAYRRLVHALGAPPVSSEDQMHLAEFWNGNQSHYTTGAIDYSEAYGIAQRVLATPNDAATDSPQQ